MGKAIVSMVKWNPLKVDEIAKLSSNTAPAISISNKTVTLASIDGITARPIYFTLLFKIRVKVSGTLRLSGATADASGSLVLHTHILDPADSVFSTIDVVTVHKFGGTTSGSGAFSIDGEMVIPVPKTKVSSISEGSYQIPGSTSGNSKIILPSLNKITLDMQLSAGSQISSAYCAFDPNPIFEVTLYGAYIDAGEEAPYDIVQLHEERQTIRDQINGLEETIKMEKNNTGGGGTTL